MIPWYSFMNYVTFGKENCLMDATWFLACPVASVLPFGRHPPETIDLKIARAHFKEQGRLGGSDKNQTGVNHVECAAESTGAHRNP
jgi:hypothetical protein